MFIDNQTNDENIVQEEVKIPVAKKSSKESKHTDKLSHKEKKKLKKEVSDTYIILLLHILKY